MQPSYITMISSEEVTRKAHAHKLHLTGSWNLSLLTGHLQDCGDQSRRKSGALCPTELQNYCLQDENRFPVVHDKRVKRVQTYDEARAGMPNFKSGKLRSAGPCTQDPCTSDIALSLRHAAWKSQSYEESHAYMQNLTSEAADCMWANRHRCLFPFITESSF